MTSPISPEWVGFNTFAPATQTKLLELLGRLKEENVNELTILVMGKCGVGKSSTVNSIIGERVVTINPFQAEGLRPVMVSRSRTGFTLNIIDTPGLIEGGYINDQALKNIKQLLAFQSFWLRTVGDVTRMKMKKRLFKNGIAWIPNLLQSITEVAISDYKSINVDKKLIERPNPNQRGKIFIPLIISLQYFVVIKPMERAIKNDIARESGPS